MSLLQLGEEDIVSVAPFKDQRGRRMMFYKIGNWKPSRITVNEILTATMLLLEIGSLEPQAQVMGGVGIFDLEGMSLNHAWHVTPSIAQKIIFLMVLKKINFKNINSNFFCTQTCMPHRTDEIHILNNGWAFDVMFQMFKPFLNEKMRSRIFVHGTDLCSFHRHIVAKHLPRKYGGIMPNIDYKEWMDSLIKNDNLIKNLQQLGYLFDPSDYYIKH